MKIKSAILLFVAISPFSAGSSEAAVLASWTFETSVPTTAGPHAAESGIYASTSFASVNTGGTVSNPSGWGSTESFSSINWNTNEYFQFTTNTTGYRDVTLGWQQTGSSTGPADFSLFYSTNGTDFTSAGAYTVTADTWNGTATPAASVKGFDLSAVSALDNKASVVFRLVNTSTASIGGGTVASNGTGRVDNFTISAIPEPSSALLGSFGLLALLRRRR